MASNVGSVYVHVMQDVINNVRADFKSDNLDESVLLELQSLWEAKMLECNALLPSEIPPRPRPVPSYGTSVQDLNEPYTGAEEYTPSTEMLTPTPALLFSPYDATATPESTPVNRSGLDVNVPAWEEEDSSRVVTKDFLGKRKRDDGVPQHDGADDGAVELHFTTIAQRDGPADNYNEVAEEDYNEGAEEEPVQAPAPVQPEVSEGSEPPLNEDDDEVDVDDIDNPQVDLTTANMVLAQFEKVTRSKNKWKCVLKDGIMTLNGRDYLFLKGTGDFEF